MGLGHGYWHGAWAAPWSWVRGTGMGMEHPKRNPILVQAVAMVAAASSMALAECKPGPCKTCSQTPAVQRAVQEQRGARGGMGEGSPR